MKLKKYLCAFCVISLMAILLTVPAFAAGGDVAGAVEQTWDDAATQIKTVVDNVVFPALSMILAIAFFVKLGMSYFDYRTRGQFEWTGPAILFVCLNCQDTIFGGFAPGSQTAEVLSRNLGTRTVQSGSVSQSKNDPSQSLQMVERPLMTPDELKSIPKGHFVVMKTGCHPMQTRLRLFLEWGITFEKEGYTVPVRENMQVHYAGRKELEESILCHALKNATSEKADAAPPQNGGQEMKEEDGHARPSDDSSLRT